MSSNKELVSIVVPVYNNEKYLRECIDSLINQTYKNIEIILINDGSTDNSLEICERYSEKFKNILVLNQKNSGPSAARNNGILHANGKYTILVDSDDYVDSNMIEKLVKNNKQGIVVRTNIKRLKEGKIIETLYDKYEYDSDEYLNAVIEGRVMGNSWGFLYNTSVLKKNLYDEKTSYIEDIVFLSQYLKNVKKVNIIKDIYYYSRINDNSITNRVDNTYLNIKSICYSIAKVKEFYPKKAEILEKKKIF